MRLSADSNAASKGTILHIFPRAVRPATWQLWGRGRRRSYFPKMDRLSRIGQFRAWSFEPISGSLNAMRRLSGAHKRTQRDTNDQPIQTNSIMVGR
jgi:hypothetical protein